ncbi:uncharacterized protein LOC123319159 isoform X2 [Coccinella septempunctata]|uniref:uncharacterized protein LOC123319159 isoform X2 n=1 Tax=Coccinella septempunctata TaxID=41139 RepID=UPI001D07B881|nr:uncharacterized protein LOC123319159 isoform X2 [Coccinella septempunctata]
MQNTTSISKAKRSIYSNFIYPTDNNDRRIINKTGDFKSSSAGCFLDRTPTFAKQLNEKLEALKRLQDSSTQTSKTILQLAKIESECMSPDSLNQSPKNKTTILRNTDTQTSLEAMESSEGYVSCDNDKVFELVEGRSSQPPPNSANTDADAVQAENEEVQVTNTIYFDAGTDTPPDLNHHQATTLIQSMRERCSTPFVETYHPNFVQEADKSCSVTPSNLSDRMETNGRITNSSSVSSTPRSSTKGKVTYMAPTISSENKNAQNVIRQLNQLFTTSKRGRSASPKCKANNKEVRNIPYVERSLSTASYDAFKAQKKSLSSSKSTPYQMEASANCSSMDFFFNKETIRRESEENSSVYNENIMSSPLAKIKDQDWNKCIQGLAEIIDCCRMVDVELIFPHMTTINQKLIELLRSPRSHVCRTACQAAGHLFEFVRDTRRPEFDEVVDLLLFKTADANKFIRQDANLALDCMVTHIPTAHAIRALCSKGPTHKNYLVRTATVRLVVCAVVIAGSESILNPNNSEQTRKKIFHHLPKFVEDKNLEKIRRTALQSVVQGIQI